MLVIDTNIWVSYALKRKGPLGSTLAEILEAFPYAFSDSTFCELTEVLMREKFDPYFTKESRIKNLQRIASDAEWFSPTETITDCRDLKDNKFLELAVEANASHILTGDADLLCLDPYRGSRILKISEFVIGP